jgi:translocation and assembly module TamA
MKTIKPFHLPILELLLVFFPIAFFSGWVLAEEKPPLEIVVQGVEGEVRKNIESSLALPEGIVQGQKVDEALLNFFIREIPKNVTEALEPYGFYNSRVQTGLERQPGLLKLTVQVQPGEPVRITALQFSIQGPGAQDNQFRKNIPAFPLKKGDILNQETYEEAKKNLLEKAHAAGYLDADFPVHRINLHLKENRAEIELVLDTGHIYYFGEAAFESPLIYPESYLRRFLTFHPGMPFNPQRLIWTQTNLINSDRFREANVEALKEEARDYHIPVRIRLVPSKPKRLRFGANYETDLGFGVMGRYQDLNFFNTSHELNTELRISERLQGYVLDYVIPQSGSVDDKLILKGGYKREITDTYDSRSLFSQMEYEHRIAWGRIVSAYVMLLQENYSIAGQNGLANLIVPGLKYWRRRYDNPINPTHGYRYSLETRGSTSAMGAEGSFVQGLFQADTLIPVGKGYSLLLRGQAGATWQNQPLTTLPPSLRFFAGGDNSVRGYDYKSLGTKDDFGRVIGGKHLLVGSIEIEKAISSIWGVAAFYDTGNAFEAFNNLDLKQGAGIGLRFYTPVGPIRIDLARQIGVDSPQYHLHLSIGFGL